MALKMEEGDTLKTGPVAGYENLQNLDFYRKGMSGKETDQILLELLEKDRNDKGARKVTSLEVHRSYQDRENQKSVEKAETQRFALGDYLGAGSTTLKVVSACAGGPQGGMVGFLTSALGDGVDQTSKSFGHKKDATYEGQNHAYSGLGRSIQDLSHAKQNADREIEADTSAIDRIVQATDRLVQLLVGNS